MARVRQRLSQLNASVTWITLALCSIGLVNLYSATSTWGQSGASAAFYSQIIWMISGIAVCLLIWLIDTQELERFAYPFYWLSMLGLVAVLLWGREIAGHQSWLKIGFFRMQPSEFAKIGLVFALAKHFAGYDNPEGMRLRDMGTSLALVSVPLVLTILQGDLGTAMFFALTWISLMLFMGVRRKTLAWLSSAGVVFLLVAYFFLLSPYQRSRIQTFMQPDMDPHGQGYQMMQSKIAVGSGKLLGKGYLQGMQNKLLYLPEKHTDFVFPVLAEEWGFIGASLTLLLYFALIMAGANIARKARDRFGLLLALGVTILLFWQVVINIGGVLGLLPLTGVTLPLLSYGGSSLMTTAIAIGILLNIRSRRQFF